MTQIISRCYSSRENAAEAVRKLKRTGYEDDAINVVEPPDHYASDSETGATADDPLVQSVSRGGVSSTHAAAYADRIRQGETLVSVQAPFGCAASVASILDSCSPTETGLADQGYDHPPRDPATPLSSACGWRVLIDNPTPLSSWLGWSTLSRSQPARKPDRELVDDPAPFSKKIGMRVLSDNSAPFSSRFSWRLLSDNPAPLSAKLGWPLLSKDQKPPPMRFGMKLRSDNPAPFSSRFGWKLLSDNPAPLSKLLGWRVLSSDPRK